MSGVQMISEALTAGQATAAMAAKETGNRLAGASRLNAVLHWSQGLLDAEAERIDRALATGKTALPLAGVPVAVKDNIVTTEQPTTCGSRILEGYVSPFTATALNRLRNAGAMIAC
ncbi:MAG: amidase family protein, partial [bacterium]